MRLLQSEYVLKGIYLGLVLIAALHLAAIPEGPETADLVRAGLLRVNISTLAGLGIGLLIAAGLRMREALASKGRLIAFLLFLILESPTLTYLGILGGTFTGIYLLRDMLTFTPEKQAALQALLLPVVGGAAAAGLVFGLLRQVQHQLARLLLILVVAGGLVTVALNWVGLVKLDFLGNINRYDLENPTAFAIQILLGIPYFYLLTFSGHEEESEVEIGVICGMLGLGLILLFHDNKQFGSLSVLLPIILYFGYTIRILPGLRVMKHAFRGISYSRVGRHRRALLAFRRALQLDPANHFAREGFWEVHRSLDLDKIANDPQTLSLVDLNLCLDRAGSLLLSKPSPAQLDEANRLLNLVLKLDPDRLPQVTYWHAVAHTHARRLPQASEELVQILDPSHFGADNPHRFAVLLPAWLLALVHHGELRRLVGEKQLALPGRRMEAIHALEKHRHNNPDDTSLQSFRVELYQGLTEAEYNVGACGDDLAAPYVDHDYLQQMGLQLINDDARWQRGGEYLRLAARGLPDLGPALFVQIAQAQQRAGMLPEARHNYELAKRAGQGVGQKNLADAQRQAYFYAVKFLADEARERKDVDAAIENLRLYSESERSGVETLRTLADLYELRGDPLAAARATDQALQYNAKDPDLLERKDRYYYSILPEDLTRRLEHFGHGFDVPYCLQRAKHILDRYTEMEWLDVANHLTQLAMIVKPESLTAKMMFSRIQLRLGEREKALTLLEEVRGPQKPERFASGEDEEAWYQASQQLGDLYLEIGRADLAVPCLNDFRKSSKSGARTLFKLGQAFEALGDYPRATKWYEQVTAYENNPLAPEAEAAISRLKG